jgi:hypothetical protein
MYRNDWEAAVARATALEQQLKEAQSATVQDQMRIAELTVQLQGARAELARLQQGMPQMPPGFSGPGPYGMPYGAAPYGMGYPQAYMYPDRSGTIMVLGILSLLVCAVMGPIAWSMGNEELRRIDSGQSPPEGRSNASAGRICGIISSIIMICGFALFVIGMVAALAASGHHSSSY